MGLKWDIENFTGSNDFGLWKVNTRSILIQQKCVEALKGKAQMHAHLTPVEKTEMDVKAVSAIIFCLRDKVLNKLDSLYMTKSLAYRQCLKQQQLHFYRMVDSKPIMEQLTEFNKIINGLVNIDVNLDNEDKTFHLVCALPKSF